MYKDDLEALSATISTADGIIFGSPTYASNVSAQM
ncbi:MAG: flavodoxin family protein, partial [Clostridia bacterium]|nr:flavodoxin family protein [Clostridia bacterium]